MKPRRLTRPEQTERNRSLVLTAARRVFMARGYHGATLEQIADEAGFSKGVVYSQFGNKADLFLTLLEARIEERAEENARVVEGMAGERGVAFMFEHAARASGAEPEWGLLVIEFRVHAARNPQLRQRYAAAHERTVERVADLLAHLYERGGEEPPFAPRRMAVVMLTLVSGIQLEHVANPEILQAPMVEELVGRLLMPSTATAHAGSSQPAGAGKEKR